ncbi:MAG: hypothetical protein VYA53_03155 [Acidobacteriota bacterium]|nr:hypothetical protein [Acidobacteriota bacterium]
MARKIGLIVLSFVLCSFTSLVLATDWNPPHEVSRERILEGSKEILSLPDIPLEVREEIFKIRTLGMDWDMGAMVYEPEDSVQIPVGPDGKKLGAFLLHGGSGDHRSKDDVARLLAGKFGFKVVSMSYPGRLYLLDASRNWPGDTINPDGTVRMPIWNKDKLITSDQYEVVEDKSMMERYGTVILACAKEGTEFYHRMAGWPMAFEEAGKDLMRRHLPEGEYSIYVHGHSTGGPFAFMLAQRVENIAGIIGMESSPFGYIYAQQVNQHWHLPFNCLKIRTWRDVARYAGPEALGAEGPEALLHLPMLMEQVFESWSKGTKNPLFKAEYPVHLNGVGALRLAAKATAQRLEMNSQETDDLVRRFGNYTRELSDEGDRPFPPAILGTAQTSRDHTLEIYKNIVLPIFAAMQPAPKVHWVPFRLGVHSYSQPEQDLPMGVAPAVAQLWYEAIMEGYFIQ